MFIFNQCLYKLPKGILINYKQGSDIFMGTKDSTQK